MEIAAKIMRKGSEIDVKNDKIRAVVVGGWVDEEGKERMIQLIGAFENPTEAFGEAYLYLDEFAVDGQTISTTERLEGDTGYALLLKKPDGTITEYAYVLLKTEENEVMHNDRLHK